MKFHYMLMADQSIYQKKLMQKLADTELTLGQPKVLEYLSENDGANQKDIATACFMEPASITFIINGMETKGLVERRRMNGNRRNYYVFLTDKGKEMYGQVEAAFVELEKETFAEFTDEETETFLTLYRRLSEKIFEL